jgi:hypothetical protein
MASKLKPRDIKELLSKQNAKAFDQLNLRHQAEYTAKGLKPGDDPELDKKFDTQKDNLFESIQKREQWIKELEATDNLDQISNELDADDPYELNTDDKGNQRPIEPDAQSDYFKGFTQGYKLQELAPDINEAFINSGNPNDERIQGMKDGREQHGKDKDLDSDISPEIWDELNTNKGEIETGRSQTKEPDKGKDIN